MPGPLAGGMPRVEARGLSFARPGNRVLERVSLRVEPGECVAIVGPNGVGKTTLIQCLAGLLRPQEGEILIGGRPQEELSARERALRLAYVPQADGRSLPFSVQDFVMMGRFAHHGLLGAIQAQDRAAVERAMEDTHLLPLRERPMDRLSGGERQKAFIAAALAQGSPLLLLDEPTTFLDYGHQVSISRLLRSFVGAEGRSILLVTHDLNTAARLAHRILALVEGRVLFEGTPEEFLDPEVLQRIYGTAFLLFQGPQGRLYGEPAFS